MNKQQLIGTWKLVSFELRLGDGILIRPMGEGVQGILIYTPDDRVVVQLFDPERPRFAEDDWMRGTPEETQTAFEGSLAYYGTYELEPHKGMILHHIQGCTFPNWINTDQERIVELEGDELTLVTPQLPLSGEQVVGRLVFRHT